MLFGKYQGKARCGIASKGAGLFAAFLSLLTFPITQSARGQDAAGTPVVSLSSDTGMRGSAVVLTLSLKPPEGTVVTSAEIEFTVPESLVKLKGVRPSLALGVAGAQMNWDTKPSPEGEKTSLVKVTIVSKNPLPPGAVASLDLRIAENTEEKSESKSDVKPEAKPQSEKAILKMVSARLTTSDGKTITNPATKDGEIAISKTTPTFVNCFFFSH